MIKFINEIINREMLTEFIKEIFNYENLFDYNYIFRMVDKDNFIIIDIYDNVSKNRFNKYIFDFFCNQYDVLLFNDGDVVVKKISIINADKNGSNFLKLAYLFSLDISLMLDYARGFLGVKFVKILEFIIENKPILW